jgi:hypothetical protein
MSYAEPRMILGLLRARLQGARRIPLSIGKFLVGFEPLRQILGAPHGHRSVELSGGNGTGEERSSRSGRSKSRRRYLSRRPDLQSVMRSRASFCPAGWSPTHGLCTSWEMANIVTRLATSSLRCSTRAASCSANYPPTQLPPIFTAFTGQFSLQKEQRIRGRAIVLTVLQAGLFEDAFTASRNFVWLHGCPLPAGPI